MEERGDENDEHRFFWSLASDNEKILTAMANGLPAEDLRNFRLASRLFYRASLPSWRNKTVPRVDFAPAEANIYRHPSYQEMLTIDEALNLSLRTDDLLQLGKHRWNKFRIFHWTYYESDQEHDELIKQFFIKWSSSLQNLALCQCDAVGSPPMVNALKYATNLKTLAWNHCDLHDYTGENQKEDNEVKNIKGLTVTNLIIDKFYDPELNEPLRRQCFTILYELPLLKKLTIHLRQPLWSTQREASSNGLVEALHRHREQVGHGLLQVKIYGIVEFDGSIDELLEKVLPMEDWKTIVEPENFENRLSMKASKLRVISLDHSRESSRINVYRPTFPFDIVMPALQKISMFGKVTNSLNFLSFMPALQNLVILRYIENWQDENNIAWDEETEADRENDDFVENTLEVYKFGVEMQFLTYLETDCYFKMNSLPVLKRMIPNLAVLKIIVQSNEMFSLICESWPNLTQLTVLQGSRVDDSGITGVESENATTRHPNLTTLKDLESFEISSVYDLTDQSVDLSFAVMENLCDLLIHTPTNFSEFCTDWLDDTFGIWTHNVANVRENRQLFFWPSLPWDQLYLQDSTAE